MLGKLQILDQIDISLPSPCPRPAPKLAKQVLTGIRLAVGVAWIVIVPAEFLGITSGLGYTIQDSRENLMYDSLAVMILVIGILGFLMDGVCMALIKRFSWHRG